MTEPTRAEVVTRESFHEIFQYANRINMPEPTLDEKLHDAIDNLARIARQMPNTRTCIAFRLTLTAYGAEYSFDHQHNPSFRNLNGEWIE